MSTSELQNEIKGLKEALQYAQSDDEKRGLQETVDMLEAKLAAENKPKITIEPKTPESPVEIQNPEVKDNAYVSQSKSCTSVDTVVPHSMRYDMHEAIKEVDERVHGVDAFVAEKLGYTSGKCSIEEKATGHKCLCDAFSSEQVDAIAVAIYNIEQKGQGCIIGDQTGIGKGRIAAGMIRYAAAQNLKAIFLTEKPNLFSDLFRDIINIGSDDAIPLEVLKGYRDIHKKVKKEEGLEETDQDEDQEPEVTVVKMPVYKVNENYESDIVGKRQLKPFIVNGRDSKTDIKDEGGNILYKGLQSNELKNVIDAGVIPADADFVLGTYSQFRGATDSTKMQYLLKIAQGNIVIMDESHNASGSSNVGTFLKKALSQTKGVVFLSATFAKRPDNMPIYASKTAMSEANMTSEALVTAITTGGVALQEIVSSNLVAEGQMIRRERSFEGIEVNYHYLDVSQELRGFPNLNKEQEHRAIMDAATSVIRDIIAFQTDYVEKEIEALDKIQKAEYKEVEGRKGTKNAGIDNMPVFSGIFNIINQLLFSIKAESVAEVAIQRLKEGKKPVIAFASTMESFLNQLTNDDGSLVKDGDIISSDFSKIFEKRLAGVLRYTEKDESGESEGKMMDVTTMSEEFQTAYYGLVDKLKKLSIGLSSSPIDVLTDKLEKAGYTFVEVTGRTRKLKILPNGKAQVKSRVKIGANDAFRQFNNNEVDCLLINQSGSTGASAHAIATKLIPKDQVKQRVMIILQAELNINTEVQKRGRINRTGQILKPIYDYAISAIPAEKRLMMMLQKKLKSLDANTSSSQKQSEDLMDAKQADFLNKYGDMVVVAYLKENPLINKQIGDPLKIEEGKEGKETDETDAAHRVSGRVAILTCKEQEDFYQQVAERYVSTVKYLRQTGEYDLEVEDMNLEAETIEKDIVVVGKGGQSVFGRHSMLEKCTINNLRKPFKQKEVEAMVTESLGTYTPQSLQKSIVDKCKTFFINLSISELQENEEHYKNLIANIPNEKKAQKLGGKELEFYISERTTVLNEAAVEQADRTKTALDNKWKHINGIISSFVVGQVIGFPEANYNMDGAYYKGVFLGFDIKETAKNPYAPSAMSLRFAIAGSLKYVAVPASKFDTISLVKAITTEEIFETQKKQVKERWDDLVSEKSADRIIRYIVTGNILQAFGKPELKGSLISYTTSTGSLKKGILLSDSFDPASGKNSNVGVPIIKALPLILALQDGSSIITKDGLSIVRRKNDYRIAVPASKAKGGQFYMNETLKKLMTEKTFNKLADQMVGGLEIKKITNLVEFLQSEFNQSVELNKNQFDRIKDDIESGDYTDEEKMPESQAFINKLVEDDAINKPISKEAQAVIKPEWDKMQEFIKDKPSIEGEIIIGSIAPIAKETGKEELKYKSIPAEVKKFMPLNQQKTVNSNIVEFQDAIENLMQLIKQLPETYGTDGQGGKAIAYLHYFHGSQDWYITEQDKKPEQLQAFGLVNLFGDFELGYISIEEIKQNGKVELDFHWKPESIRVIKGSEEFEEETNEEQAVAEMQKEQIVSKSNDKPSPESNQRFSDIKEIDRSEIITMPELFQGRQNEFSQESVDKIVSEGFDKSNDPIIVWYNPEKEKYVVISGHSRWRASQVLFEKGDSSLQTMPVKEFLGDIEEAKSYALLESNRASTQEGLISDINAVKKMVADGYNKANMLKYIKPESKLNNIINYTYLNPNGKFIEHIEETKSFPYIERNAIWVGELRKANKEKLTDLHENEMFDYMYLTGNSKGLKLNKSEFFNLIGSKVSKMFYDASQPLNLTNVVSTSAVLSPARAKINEIQSDIEYWNKEIEKKRLLIARANQEGLTKMVPQFNEYIDNANKKLLSLHEDKLRLESEVNTISNQVVSDLFSMKVENPLSKKVQTEIIKQESKQAFNQEVENSKLEVKECEDEIAQFRKNYKKSVLHEDDIIEINTTSHIIKNIDTGTIYLESTAGRHNPKTETKFDFDELAFLFNKGSVQYDGYTDTDGALFDLMLKSKQICLIKEDAHAQLTGAVNYSVDKISALSEALKNSLIEKEKLQSEIANIEAEKQAKLDAIETQRLEIENTENEAKSKANLKTKYSDIIEDYTELLKSTKDKALKQKYQDVIEDYTELLTNI